ncbi:MAG: Rab family GTPase [Candidatus Heimdallarchaeota archaeon]
MDHEVRLFKIVLAGDGAVGKTSLRKRYMGYGFKKEYISTIGADFVVHETIIGNETIRWQIWDIAGQPKFSQMIKTYYKRCIGGIVVYDITRQSTFKNVLNWATEIWKYNGLYPVIPLVLVGNKTDLRLSREDTLSIKMGKQLAEKLSETTEKNGFSIPYVETSALTGEKVQQAFQELRDLIVGFLERNYPG